MAILVKHNKVSTVPDTADTSLVRPSDWNADHTLTGFGTAAELNAGSANGVATLDAGGTVPLSQIPASLQGGVSYQGTWNATTNSPTITSGTGTKGYYYVVSVAGSTDIDGITTWNVGDWIIFNGTAWQKVDNTDAVTSVNGFTGTVVLTTTNVAEGTNEYFTQARARQSLSAGTGISYDNTTGVITNSSPSLGGDVVGPASATDNAIARYDSTTGKLIQNSVVTVSDTGAIAGATTITDLDYLDFDTTYATTLGAGQLGWDGNNTLGLGMSGGNVIQKIGEDTYFYVKASSAITKGQLCMFTGAVGSSGVVTAAPSTAIPYAEAIIGVAAEDIALNGFGLIQNTGSLRGVDTSAFLDGDVLYYNSAVTGGLTKTYPTSGPVVVVAAVANSGSGGSGVLVIRVSFQTRVTGSTGISVSQGNDTVVVTNTAPDQTVSISGSTGISTSGTYPNFTVTNTAPDQVVSISGGGTTTVTGTYPNFTVSSDDQYDGTVTSVDLSAGTGISVSGGPITTSGSITVTNTAPDQTVVLNAGTGISTSGTYPNFTVTNTAPDQTVAISAGTGISVSGTYPNFTVTNTAPDVPFTYTSTYVPYGQGTTTPDQSADFTYDESVKTLSAPQVNASNGIHVNSATISASYSIPSGSNAMSAGPVSIASGVTVTVPSGNNWVIV